VLCPTAVTSAVQQPGVKSGLGCVARISSRLTAVSFAPSRTTLQRLSRSLSPAMRASFWRQIPRWFVTRRELGTCWFSGSSQMRVDGQLTTVSAMVGMFGVARCREGAPGCLDEGV